MNKFIIQVFSWQLFSDCQTQLNEFKVRFLIMQNVLRFGFLPTIFLAPHDIASRTSAEIKNIQTFMCARETIKCSI